MVYIITDKCVSCGTCESQCPAEAIKQNKNKYIIDKNKCVDCGTCAEACPAEAIKQE